MSVGLFKPNIAKLKERKDIPRLIKTLSLKDGEVRVEAAAALGELKDVRAVDHLVTALNDGSPGVRISAARSLGQIGNRRAVKPLVALLSDRYLRMIATKALAEIADESCVDGLIIALNTADRDCHVGNAVEVRYIAAAGLGRIGHARAVNPLIRALKDSERGVRDVASEALRKIGPEAVDQLISAVKDTNQPKDLRFTAATIVGKIGGRDDPIVQAWDAVATKDWERTRSLGDLSVEPLLAIAEDPSHIWEAAKALVKISPQKALILFLDVLDGSRDKDRRAAAEKEITEIAESNLDPLISALKDSRSAICLVAAEMLGRTGGSRAVNALICALRHGDPVVRAKAAEILGKIRDTKAVDPLINMLKDVDRPVQALFFKEVSWYAINALSEIGDKRAEHALFAVLKDQGRSSETRDAAFKALEKIGATEDPLVKAWGVVQKQDWTLATSMGVFALEPLILALSSAKDVRKGAAEVLRKLYQSGKLDDDALKRILSVKQIMEKEHSDVAWGCGYGHGDSGIGVSLE
jgi:HEAT repeat protein